MEKRKRGRKGEREGEREERGKRRRGGKREREERNEKGKDINTVLITERLLDIYMHTLMSYMYISNNYTLDMISYIIKRH